MDFKKIKEIRQKCISHANNLLSGSKLLLKNGFHNIAYHLAALALEEIGKSVMLVIGYASVNSQKGAKILRLAGEDHTKKLFWALWGPTFGKKDMSREQIESFINLSNKIHLVRLAGLYVNPFQDTYEPSELITPKEAKQLISIAEARIKMEEHSKIKEPDQEIKNSFIWFVAAVEDPEKKKLIFGKKSIDKLKEFEGNAAKWVQWLHEQFEKADKESQELLQRELNKKEPSDKEKRRNKWQIRFKLVTSSHSIRHKALNEWNSKIELIKLALGKKTSKTCELIVDMILPAGVPLQTLWYVAWGQARAFAVSLNIATRGYFWWYLPRDISRFYEKIIDLESKAEVYPERRPILSLDWGNNVLSIADLNRAAMCYKFLPKGNVDFLNAYVTGISLMGKNDIHTPFEQEIFLQFFHALLYAMKFYKDYKNNGSLEDVVDRIFKPLMKDSSGIKGYIQMAEELKSNKKSNKKITLSECGVMKILFDVYVFHRINIMAEKELRKDKSGK
ncbi:MAG: hypothetical protein DRP08_03900 [Candidatus Aenigmatarchaeota archaeon]|nr:MAG: hypothetical protein DRP08_03900 [Candidatus Aenigmarchaeota archaeon]